MKYEVHRTTVMLSLVPEKGKVFVDVPCGDGQLLAAVVNRYTKLIGYDIAQVRVDNAQGLLKPLAKHLELKVHDVDKGLPLADNSVDVLTCNASIGCFVYPEFFLQEVHRVLKKNGVFVVQIGNYAFLARRLMLLFGRLPKISGFPGFGDGGMLHYFTYAVLAELIEKAGLKITQRSNSGLFAGLRKIWPELLASDIIYQATKP
jgi:ubiquinone/menaquinone biosynthesis C-methylase UbiE